MSIAQMMSKLREGRRNFIAMHKTDRESLNMPCKLQLASNSGQTPKNACVQTWTRATVHTAPPNAEAISEEE